MPLKGTLTGGYFTPVTLTTAGYTNPVTVTGSIGVFGFGAAIYAPAPVAWTIANQGTIENVSSGSSAIGVSLGAGGVVSNAAGAYIFGDIGVYSYGGAATVTNAGTIKGSVDAVALTSGYANRVVTNPGAVFAGTVSGGNSIGASVASTLEMASGASAGTLSGLGVGYIDFARVTVDNGATWVLAGDNTNAAGATIFDNGVLVIGSSLANNGSVAGVAVVAASARLANQSGGVINGGTGVGVYSGGASFGVSVNNAGVVTASGGTHAAVGLHDGGYIGNAATGTISSAGGPGIYLTGAAGTVVNAGSISATKAAIYIKGVPGTLHNNGRVIGGATGSAVVFTGGGYVSNAAAGLISSGEHSGLYFIGGAGHVVNAGDIAALGTSGAGVIFESGGTASNASGGTLSAAQGAGIYAVNGSATLFNAGRVVAGADASAVAFSGGGLVSNAATGVILSPKYAGVYITGQPGTVLNAGSIGSPGSTGAGAVLMYSGGTVTNSAGGVIGSAHHLGVSIAGAGTVVNAGSIFGAGDAVKLTSGFANRVVVDPGAGFGGTVDGGGNAVLELAAGHGSVLGIGSSFVNFGSIEFDPAASWSISGSTAGLAGGQVIGGFANGDTVALVGVSETIDNFANGTLTLTGSAPLHLLLPGDFTTPQFSAKTNADGTDITVACFVAGTRILTDAGEVEVERLTAGARVFSLLHRKLLPVVWIGHRKLSGARPVRVRAGAFAAAVPHRDLLLSPDHALFIDGVLLPVRYLVNGTTIAQERHDEVFYYHLELAEHGVLLAEGLPAESYLDTGNRAAFAAQQRRFEYA